MQVKDRDAGFPASYPLNPACPTPENQKHQPTKFSLEHSGTRDKRDKQEVLELVLVSRQPKRSLMSRPFASAIYVTAHTIP